MTTRQSGTPSPRRLIITAVARVVASTTLVVVVYYLLPLDTTDDVAILGWLVAGLAAVVIVTALQVRSILRGPHPALRAVTGIGVAIPLFVVVFASTYLAMTTADPGAFSEPLSHTDALYLTMTIFSTVGFGDITPQSETARVAVTVQMAAGLVVIGILARVVVGAVQEARHRQGPGPLDQPEP